MEELKYLDSPSFDINGINDMEGYQIFTPEFIVKDMIDTIGKKNINDFNKTILEPASGDGAFTCRILSLRLKNVNKNCIEADSLRALATIYSIEMDKELLIKQRNNIYTIMINFAKKHNITNEKYFDLLKDIIKTNINWAMTNITNKNTGFIIEVAYKMPEALKENFIPIDFYKWNINDDLTFSKEIEEVESW